MSATTSRSGFSARPHRFDFRLLGVACSDLRGRLLVFPHVCPHAGSAVGSVPKLFLRGELLARWEAKG